MSDPNAKGESPTQMFKLKLDGWVEEMLKSEAAADAAASAPEAGADPTSDEAAPAVPPPAPGFGDAPAFAAVVPPVPPKR